MSTACQRGTLPLTEIACVLNIRVSEGGSEREREMGVALERWEGLYDCVMKNTISAEL